MATNTNIANIKVWSSKGEYRIYVRMLDGREGCYYLTGNRYNQPRSYDGNLTKEEWAEVRKLAVVDGKWTNRYESELHGTIFGKAISSAPKPTFIRNEEDTRNDIRAEKEFRPVILAESELFG
jgi:hypothetical protein